MDFVVAELPDELSVLGADDEVDELVESDDEPESDFFVESLPVEVVDPLFDFCDERLSVL